MFQNTSQSHDKLSKYILALPLHYITLVKLKRNNGQFTGARNKKQTRSQKAQCVTWYCDRPRWHLWST